MASFILKGLVTNDLNRMASTVYETEISDGQQSNHHHTSGPFGTPATSNKHGDALIRFLTA